MVLIARLWLPQLAEVRVAAAGISAETVLASTADPSHVIPLKLKKSHGPGLEPDSKSHKNRRRNDQHADTEGSVNGPSQMCMRACFEPCPPTTQSHLHHPTDIRRPEIQRFETSVFQHHPSGSHLRQVALLVRWRR